MADLSAYCDYMRAHLRAHGCIGAGSLTQVELYDAFHTLPLPAVAFPDWMERTGRTSEPRASASGPLPDGRGSEDTDPTPEEIEAANGAGVAAAMAMNGRGFPVNVEAPPAAGVQ